MKTLKITMLFLFLTGGSLYAQNFLETGNILYYEYYIAFNPLLDQSIETITVGNDTLINNKIYQELTISKTSPCLVFSTTEFIREDSGKVYRYRPNYNTEFLMMDFNETFSYEIPFEANWSGGGALDTAVAIIDSVNTIQVYDGTNIEVQYMRILNNQSSDDNYTYQVYTNIGFIGGSTIFPDLGTGLCDVYEWFGSLRCLVTPTDTIQFTEFGCDEIVIVDSVDEVEQEAISIYPNPTANEFVTPQGYQVIAITSIDGKKQAYQQHQNIITLGNLPQGLYFVHLKSPKGIYATAKIMKNEH